MLQQWLNNVEQWLNVYINQSIYISMFPMRCNNGYVKGISIHVANSSLQIWIKIKQIFIYLPDKDVKTGSLPPEALFPIVLLQTKNRLMTCRWVGRFGFWKMMLAKVVVDMVVGEEVDEDEAKVMLVQNILVTCQWVGWWV